MIWAAFVFHQMRRHKSKFTLLSNPTKNALKPPDFPAKKWDVGRKRRELGANLCDFHFIGRVDFLPEENAEMTLKLKDNI